MKKPTFISLFAGIGGIDLGLERAGFECVAQVEWDSYCTEVLTKHWPSVPKFQDIKDVTSEQLRSLGPVDLVAGGFPCQPVSVAGRQKAQADERWLWPEFARVIRTVRPRVVFVENVPGLLTANSGEAFSEVQSDLASLGYDTEWEVIPASAFGAPHLRKRIVLVAWCSDTYSDGRQGLEELDGERFAVKQTSEQRDDADGLRNTVSDSVGEFLRNESGWSGRPSREGPTFPRDNGTPQPVAYADPLRRSGRSRVLGPPGRGESAHSGGWTTEPDVGRVVNGVSPRLDRRSARIKALGNAVVPQFSEYVGRQIMREFFA